MFIYAENEYLSKTVRFKQYYKLQINNNMYEKNNFTNFSFAIDFNSL